MATPGSNENSDLAPSPADRGVLSANGKPADRTPDGVEPDDVPKELIEYSAHENDYPADETDEG